MSSREEVTALRELRRTMEDFPDELSIYIPLPSEEVEFHPPEVFPLEITRPSGFPSGVKNPALMARSAPVRWARSSEVG